MYAFSFESLASVRVMCPSLAERIMVGFLIGTPIGMNYLNDRNKTNRITNSC